MTGRSGPRRITRRRLSVAVDVPGSKSLTQRALVMAALAPGRSIIRRGLLADDTRVLAAGLEALGARIEIRESARAAADWVVEGGTLAGTGNAIDLGENGTATRFLTALAAALPGETRLDGAARLRDRPLAPLIAGLRILGATIDGDRLPLVIQGRRLDGGSVCLDEGVSSQFSSALLLAAPLFAEPLRLGRDARAVSRPYVDLTVEILRAFGVDVDVLSDAIIVTPGEPTPTTFDVEGDASSAAVLFAGAAATGGEVIVGNLDLRSAQADRRVVDLLRDVGLTVDVPAGGGIRVRGRPTRPIEVDLRDCSDAMPALAALAATTPGTHRLSGAAHLRLKESDRIEAMATGLRAIGVDVRTLDDGLEIVGAEPSETDGSEVVIDPRQDHRIAMAFTVLGWARGGISIADSGCVEKSWPGFFECFE